VALANTAPSLERTELETEMSELQKILEKEFRVSDETD